MRCADCPAILTAPESLEGWQVWDVALRMGGQLRLSPGGAIIGWDLAAALALAKALSVDPLIAAELLPVIEAEAVRGLNQALLNSMDMDNG